MGNVGWWHCGAGAGWVLGCPAAPLQHPNGVCGRQAVDRPRFLARRRQGKAVVAGSMVLRDLPAQEPGSHLLKLFNAQLQHLQVRKEAPAHGPHPLPGIFPPPPCSFPPGAPCSPAHTSPRAQLHPAPPASCGGKQGKRAEGSLGLPPPTECRLSQPKGTQTRCYSRAVHMLRVVTRLQRAGTARNEFKRGEDGGSHPNSLGLEHNVSPNTSPTGKKKMYYCQGHHCRTARMIREQN